MKMNSGSSSSGSPEVINGLKFGQKIYFEDASIGVPAESCGGLSTSSARPPAPARAKKGGGQQPQPPAQPPRCQVEGCSLDLSDVKTYYSRHKVCGMHSKSPMVIVAGLQQRFCQQCSRFHQLPEFDQGKRSCRRRLAGHNERRRKPPPRSLLAVPYETSSRRGFVMDFSGRNPWPTTPHITANAASYLGPAEHFTDSNCALSLLSNHSYSSRNSLVSPTNYFPNRLDPVRAPPGLFFNSSSWGSNGSTHLNLDTGLVHMVNDCGQYCGELEWGPHQIEQARAYDSSSASHHIDWSL